MAAFLDSLQEFGGSLATAALNTASSLFTQKQKQEQVKADLTGTPATTTNQADKAADRSPWEKYALYGAIGLGVLLVLKMVLRK